MQLFVQEYNRARLVYRGYIIDSALKKYVKWQIVKACWLTSRCFAVLFFFYVTPVMHTLKYTCRSISVFDCYLSIKYKELVQALH